VSAYPNFLQWKERIGRERAWGEQGFCSKVFRNREFSERMISLIEEQRAYKRAFLSLATPEQSQMIESALSGYVMECLENIHTQLAAIDQSDDLEALSPVTWFKLLTGKIDRLKLAESDLVKALTPADTANAGPSFPSTRHSLIEPHLPIIRALPAFSKLENDELSKLLSHADLRTFEKGKLLFLQDEPLSRFYLILKGWVKLFKGSDSGDEAVLQMLSSGDTLMEAAVFLDIPSTVSAQVVQDVVLLSLPAPIIRQSLSENRKFALNMINSLSMRSHGLIRQIEHSRLKTANERVGWFLLQLGIEQSGGKSSTITLPYDKSTMASYLDMTPETFSRTLKQFRNKGFRIHNDKITQPDPDALCKFCDETLAETCVYKDKPSCPKTYLI
ncbi:MAG: cyclic nucleotide-binding domain-containing protein, partial [Henriciella sp.]|nr:cyclic nucleotide-binding domain-containing protein [Henriciella sp.]